MRSILLACLFAGAAKGLAAAPSTPPWQAGFARVDVTPKDPVRLSGYGSRDRPSNGVDTPLHVRAVALKFGDDPPHILLSAETIGLSGGLVKELARQIETRHHIARQRIVVACTHTHCGPAILGELTNIFSVPLSKSEVAAARRYRDQLSEAILAAAAQALQSLAPARLSYGFGEADFAANRRVLENERWVDFGVQRDGPVDHSVPVLCVRDPEGSVRGIVFGYACHCTTLGADYNRINADWAGYAATDLETAFPGSVAMCTIGCGADANPYPLGSRDLSERHGRQLALEVKRIVNVDMPPIDLPIVARFDHAGLSFELPTIEELNRRSKDPSVQVRQHAKHFQRVFERDGRLPATYPLPVQSWQFGDQLTMIFLGGEVVVDYARRLKRELPSRRLWISAYANDVPGYIASERMRAEGGYEYDLSGVYYNLPGPWASGTEDRLVRRIREQLDRQGPMPPLEPDEALRSISVPTGYAVQLVAAEPLVRDPINLAFGNDGSLWVVEMGDYPLGAQGPSEGGRIKLLTDLDGDGAFDRATVFLDGLAFPTGVHPWGDGVIVSAAPTIFFARDRDGDGRADERKELATGFALANPQHRINGFAYGLDHSLHCAAGDKLGEITAVASGQKINASGHDVQLWPDAGRIAATSGRTQYIRSRNDWGDWFGNENSRPMYHYPIEDRYLRRNAAVRFADNKQQLFDPPVAPPVYPISLPADRFNDLFAANRFTSACSAIVVRSTALGPELKDAAFVCEPVHNLVHRAQLVDQGSTYRAVRVATEQTSEFFRSNDPWCRPVRVTIGPEGMLWIVDMYRAVIEHPEWIPSAWQQQLDLRAGSDRGRIYRVVPVSRSDPPRLPAVANDAPEELVAKLAGDNGTLRDMAQQELIRRGDKSIAGSLRIVTHSSPSPQARVHALWALNCLDQLADADILAALGDEHPGVVRNAIRLAEPRIAANETLLQAIVALVDHPDGRVRLQLALTLGESNAETAGQALGTLALTSLNDPWASQAIVSSSRPHSLTVLRRVLSHLQTAGASRDEETRRLTMIAELMATASAHGLIPEEQVASAIASAGAEAPWVFALAAACVESSDSAETLDPATRATILDVYRRATSLAADEAASSALRCQALQLLGRGLGEAEQERVLLGEVLSPATPLDVQEAAIERLASIGDRASAQQLISRWPGLTYSLRNTAALKMISTKGWAETLVAGLESGEVRPRDLSPSVRQVLHQSGGPSLQARWGRLLGENLGPSRDLVEKYLQFQQGGAEASDVARGQVLFQKHCATCHTPDAAGRATGPDLSNLSDRSARSLTESILDPNRSVEPKYYSYFVLTSSGNGLSGTIAEEAGDTLTLGLANGKRITISRSDIEDMRSTGQSVMPEGFQQELNPEMLRDLVAYLRSDSLVHPGRNPKSP